MSFTRKVNWVTGFSIVIAGCSGKPAEAPVAQAPVAQAPVAQAPSEPEATLIYDQEVAPEEAMSALLQFARRAELRGCVVKAETGEADAVLAKCGEYAIAMMKSGSQVVVACDKSTDSDECRELARQILQSGEPQLIAQGPTNDPTLLPKFKKAMAYLGCRDAGSTGNNVNMACSIGLVSLIVDGNNATFVCFPIRSADCVRPVKQALGL